MNYRQRKKINERLKLLREWYGDEVARTEIVAYCPQPALISKSLDALETQLFSEETRLRMKLAAEWPAIAGAMLAKLTMVSDFRNGELILEVRHSAFLRELEPSLDLIRGKINAYFQKDICKSIRFAASSGKK